jgi:predicted anti-sigma-YlaC factor YlaD
MMSMLRSVSTLILLAATSLLLAGCSAREYAVGRIADTLADVGRVYVMEDDPELVRAAAPFGLKLMDGALRRAPEHRGLLTAAASAYTQYAFAFVQQDADEAEAVSVLQAKQLRARAKRLYLRARDYGLRGLETAYPNFTRRLHDAPEETLAQTSKEDAALLYWTGLAWSAAVNVTKDDPELVADLPLAAALVERALQLDESYELGAGHTYLIIYEMYRPGGEGEAAARRHFARAVELSNGKLAAPYVTFAEAVAIPRNRRREFEQALQTALAIDPAEDPDYRLANIIMQKRARWLLENTENYFNDH